MIGRGKQEREQALAAVRLLASSRQRRQALLVEYRCSTPSRCLLVAVYGTTLGAVIHWPPRRVPPGLQYDLGTADLSKGQARFLRLEGSPAVDPESYLLASHMTVGCDHYPDGLRVDSAQLLREVDLRRGRTLLSP